MERNRKNITIVALSIALVTSSIGNILLEFKPEAEKVSPIFKSLNVGALNSPWDLDPINSWDSLSKDVIEQVCEGLFMHNLSDLNLGIVPRLGLDYGTWDVTGMEFTVPLRRSVWFHDGTPFNAESVKWNFERINWFINASGTLNTTLSQAHSLWEFPNGTTILDPTTPITINNEYCVTINLRAPYAILESLLCYVTAFMLSPNSTPKYEYISTSNGIIIGTGPFVYDYFIAKSEIKARDLSIAISEAKFHRWGRYWRTGAYFEELTISFFDDPTSRNDALIAQSIDFLLGGGSAYCTFCVLPVTSHIVQGFSYYYLSMNNKKINKTWRQAISYAINYTIITEVFLQNTVYRSNGPLAPNFPMSDPNIKAATWNLTKARQVLVDAGITNLTANNDTTGPIADAWKSADFQSWNYSYNIGNAFREDLGVLLTVCLDLIGVEVIDQGMTYDDFLNRAYGLVEPDAYDSMEIFFVGWDPDYLTPYNTIASLFSNQSLFNSAQYHNHDVEIWLAEVLSEINATKRAELYSKILHQIIVIDMPHAFIHHPYLSCTHSKDLRNIPYNSLLAFDAWPMYRDSNSTE